MKYLLLLLLSLNIFAQAEMNEVRKFKKQVAELKSIYSGIDAMIDGAGLPAGIATEMKDEAKLKIKNEMKQRIADIISGALKKGKSEHEAELAEEKCIASISEHEHYAAAVAALPDGNCSELKIHIEGLLNPEGE